MEPVEEVVCFGPFHLDAVQGRLWRGAEEIRLRPKAFALLHHLVRHPARLISKSELLDAVWRGTSVSDASIKICISEIRKALGARPGEPPLIETRRRHGYRLVPRTPSTLRPVVDRERGARERITSSVGRSQPETREIAGRSATQV